MADFDGELFTSPDPVEGNTGPAATINGYPNPIAGRIGVLAQLQNSTTPGTIITVHYWLTAVAVVDNLRRHWSDTAVSLANAPVVAGGYIGGTLAVLGSWNTYA